MSVEDTTIMVLDSLVQALMVPEISANTPYIDFGQVEIGDTAQFNLYLDNTRTGILEVTSATVNGPPFAVDFTPGQIYARDDSMLVTVSFVPTIAGAYADTIIIQSNGGDLAIPLNGNCPGGSSVARNLSPTTAKLISLYPNPCNASVNIELNLPEASEIEITLFNNRGEAVMLIYRGSISSGRQILRYQAQGLPSGIYYLTLNFNRSGIVQKMLLLR